ncbi:MAG: transcription antitermination factor NusB [Pseudomonadales bacterium]|nr:transcription antitermination factor NusB [Pseudomonadales bacterium]
MAQDRDFKPSARRRARRFVMQGLYEHLISGNPAHEIEARCRADNDLRKTDVDYLHELLVGCVREREHLESLLRGCLDRDMEQLTPVERSILSIGAYELAYRVDIPYQVVINEAVDLAKDFGATDGHRYVNGVLDRLAKQLRPHEQAG